MTEVQNHQLVQWTLGPVTTMLCQESSNKEEEALLKVDQFIVFIKCLFDLRIIKSTTITSDIDERQIMQFFSISFQLWYGLEDLFFMF